MGMVTPTVKLLAYTPNPEPIIATAAKLCYAKSDIKSLREGLSPEKSAEFVEKLMAMGHESPIEHITFTFGIEGISRACSHQLVRHRIASYSQQSQRYVDMNDFNYIMPPSIEEDETLCGAYEKIMADIAKNYESLQNVLAENLTKQIMNENGVDEITARKRAVKMANEDARFILPNACETKIIVTMNARSLFNFFKERTCQRAQWEIREVAQMMYKLVYPIAPTLFAHAGASCVVDGRCSEGAMSCGKADYMKRMYKSIREESVKK